MFLSNLSVKYPYFAVISNLVIFIFGLLTLSEIPVQENPNIDLPAVFIEVNYPGVSSETIESSLLKPLEDQLNAVSGVKTLHGYANQGDAAINVIFNLGVNGDRAFDSVKEAVANVPLPLGSRIVNISKRNDSEEPILNIGFSSQSLSLEDLSYVVKEEIQPELQRITGVSEVKLYGDRDKEVHIDLEQTILKSMRVSPLYLRDSISAQIANAPVGILRQGRRDMPMVLTRIPKKIQEVRELPIRLPTTGQVVPLQDFGKVEMSHAEQTSAALLNGNTFFTANVFRDPLGNIVSIAKHVREKVHKLQGKYQGKIQISIPDDHSQFIKESLDSVIVDLVFGVFLALLVVFCFLQNLKNTMICALSIPTSLVGTIAVIHQLHFSLNFMTLFAITLCIGIVIDDSIVVIENIHRHRLSGSSLKSAAKDGTGEIGFAAIAVTLSIISVFVSVAFMKGMIGRYFYEFGLTVTVAVLISLYVAFTLVPALSAYIQRDMSFENIPFLKKFHSYQEQLQNFYATFIEKILSYPKRVLVITGLVFVMSLCLLKFVPMGFNLDIDGAEAHVVYHMPPNSSLKVLQDKNTQIEKAFQKLEGIENYQTFLGGSQIDYEFHLVPKEDRNFSSHDFEAYVSNLLKKQISGQNEYVGFSESDYKLQYTLFTHRSALGQKFGKKLVNYMNSLPGVTSATLDSVSPVGEYEIFPNRQRLSQYGISSEDISDTLSLLYAGTLLGKYDDQGHDLDMRMEISQSADSQSLSDLGSVFIPAGNNHFVQLASIAHWKVGEVPRYIEHVNGARALTVKGKYHGRDLHGIDQKVSEFIEKNKPVDINSEAAGESQGMKEMIGVMGQTISLSVLFVLLVLVVQFENFAAPFAIFFSIPFAFSGAFLALLVTHNTLSVFSFIGIIMLLGLVTKNAILLVEFAQQKLEQKFFQNDSRHWDSAMIGNVVKEALMEAGSVRLRPILMTTLTMIFGMLPMALSHGMASEIRENIAITVIGGLFSSTILTLLIIPTVYLLLIRLKARRRA